MYLNYQEIDYDFLVILGVIWINLTIVNSEFKSLFIYTLIS